MDLDEFLSQGGTDLASVLAALNADVRLHCEDEILAVGSLVEGIGNSRSDLDLLVITPRLRDQLRDTEFALVSGRCLIDVKLVPRADYAALIARLSSWARAAWDVSQAANFTIDERILLHRVAHGHSIGPPPPGQTKLPKTDLLDVARLKLHCARQMARTIQVDISGYRECGDYHSMGFAAQELLGHAVDGLLAAYHRTNPLTKWRSRLLESLPPEWERRIPIRPTGRSASDTFWQMNRAPERPEEAASVRHALGITTFARATFWWAELIVVEQEDPASRQYNWAAHPRSTSEPTLPHLAFDTDFHLAEDGVTLARLNTFSAAITVPWQEFGLALLFDGVTTAREADSTIFGVAAGAGGRMAERLHVRLAKMGLIAPTIRPL